METRQKQAALFGIEKRRRHFLRKRSYADAFESRGYKDLAVSLRQCEETESLVGCQHCGHSWWVTSRCRTRVCPLCSYNESKKRAKFLMAMTADMTHPKLVTLTMDRWDGCPREGIRHLRKMVSKMRRTKLFEKVAGGAYQIELKRKPIGWHIHIHLLLDAPFLPYQKLFSEWKRITGQAYVSTDVRAATTREAREYVVKYPTKSASFDTHPEAIVDWYEATKGLRLFATFGKWFNATLSSIDPEQPEEDKGIPCPKCGEMKTCFYVRDGPFIFGGKEWRSVEAMFSDGSPLVKTIEGSQEILASRRGVAKGIAPRDPMDVPTYEDDEEEENGPM